MTIAWHGFHCTFSKPGPRASSLHTLPHCSFALPVLLKQGSTSAHHVVALCASAHGGCSIRLRPVGPSSSEDESLKLKPLGHMSQLPKQSELHTTISCHTDCACSSLRSQKVSQRGVHSACTCCSSCPTLPTRCSTNCEIGVCQSFQVFHFV